LETGITFGGGIEVKNILIDISYSLGLLNLSPYPGSDLRANN
jgi:hypothetical protein